MTANPDRLTDLRDLLAKWKRDGFQSFAIEPGDLAFVIGELDRVTAERNRAAIELALVIHQTEPGRSLSDSIQYAITTLNGDLMHFNALDGTDDALAEHDRKAATKSEDQQSQRGIPRIYPWGHD